MENIENYVDDNGRLVKMEWGMVMMTNIKFLMGFRCEDVVMSEVDDHPNDHCQAGRELQVGEDAGGGGGGGPRRGTIL